jgi:hypothetical protein
MHAKVGIVALFDWRIPGPEPLAFYPAAGMTAILGQFAAGRSCLLPPFSKNQTQAPVEYLDDDKLHADAALRECAINSIILRGP